MGATREQNRRPNNIYQRNENRLSYRFEKHKQRTSCTPKASVRQAFNLSSEKINNNKKKKIRSLCDA